MKTKIFITAAAILFSINLATAGSKERTLSFRDALGRTLSMPVMEEKAEASPFDTQAEFSRIRSNNISRVFDISTMSKPEVAEELPFDLDAVLKELK